MKTNSNTLHIKCRYFGFFALWVLLATAAFGQNIPPRPSPPKLVNDFAGVLTPYQVSHLEETLVKYDDSTSVQIAVVIVNSLDGANVDDYALALGRKWGVGNKKTNNGVVLLVSVGGGEGQRKVFISPGYGLEASLSDYLAKTIVDAEMIPEFKQGNIYRGLERGVTAIISATQGQYEAPPGYSNRGEGEGGGFVFVLILLFVLFILFAGSKGGGGNDGGDAMTRRGHRHMNRPPPFIFFPPIGGGGGGGGFGGGGFGGFGGGGFGGGGAGGSW
jgi:uncharacterized protein